MGLAFQGISEHSVPTLLDLLYQVSQSHSSCCTLPIPCLIFHRQDPRFDGRG